MSRHGLKIVPISLQGGLMDNFLHCNTETKITAGYSRKKWQTAARWSEKPTSVTPLLPFHMEWPLLGFYNTLSEAISYSDNPFYLIYSIYRYRTFAKLAVNSTHSNNRTFARLAMNSTHSNNRTFAKLAVNSTHSNNRTFAKLAVNSTHSNNSPIFCKNSST